jgi:hypothetical protein
VARRAKYLISGEPGEADFGPETTYGSGTEAPFAAGTALLLIFQHVKSGHPAAIFQRVSGSVPDRKGDTR